MSNHFDSFMVVVILANVLVMLLVHAGMSETWWVGSRDDG